MKILKIFLVSLILVSFFNLAFSQDLDLETLGILDVVPQEGVSESGASIVTDIVFDTVFKLSSDRYNIIDRKMRDELLIEHQFAVSDLCDDVSCALEAGRYLSADYMLISSFAKLGSYYYVSFKIVNVTTTLVENTARAKTADLDNIEDIIYSSISELLNVEVGALITEERSTVDLREMLKNKPSFSYIKKIPIDDRILLYERSQEMHRLWNGVNILGAVAMMGGGTLLAINLLSDEPRAGFTVAGIGVAGAGLTLSILGIIKSRHYSGWSSKLEPYLPEEVTYQ